MGKKSFADVKKMARRTERSVEVCLDGALSAEVESVERELARLGKWKSESLSDVDPRLEVQGRLDGLRAQQRESVYAFRFRALPARAYSDLVAKHPPRPEDKAERLRFNVATFPAALISACCVDPEMTEDEAGELLDDLSAGQRDTLFAAAWTANEVAVSVPFSSNGSGTTPS